ncbi:MAG: rhodanese-like domain-containing protein [Pseudomonadota bacterium]
MSMTFPEMVAAARQKVGGISAEAAAADADAVILDVREAKELADARIDGEFVHIPLAQVGAEAEADPTLAAAKGSKAIYVLCAVGGRAALAGAALVDLGFDAKVIEGGIGAWSAAGLPTTGG